MTKESQQLLIQLLRNNSPQQPVQPQQLAMWGQPRYPQITPGTQTSTIGQRG